MQLETSTGGIISTTKRPKSWKSNRLLM